MNAMEAMARKELKRAALVYGEHYRPGGVPGLEGMGNTMEGRAAQKAATLADRVARVVRTVRDAGPISQMDLRAACNMSHTGCVNATALAVEAGEIVRIKPGRYYRFIMAGAI